MACPAPAGLVHRHWHRQVCHMASGHPPGLLSAGTPSTEAAPPGDCRLSSHRSHRESGKCFTFPRKDIFFHTCFRQLQSCCLLSADQSWAVWLPLWPAAGWGSPVPCAVPVTSVSSFAQVMESRLFSPLTDFWLTSQDFAAWQRSWHCCDSQLESGTDPQCPCSQGLRVTSPHLPAGLQCPRQGHPTLPVPSTNPGQ